MTIKVCIDFPEYAFSLLRTEPDSFVREMHLAAAVKWYEIGKLSQLKAIEGD